MAFEDVAARMKDRRTVGPRQRMQELWHGDIVPEPEPIELPEITPANKRGTTIVGYLVMMVGFLIAIAAGIVMVAFFSALSRWEFRGLIVVVAIGVAIIGYATRLLEAADEVAPLPRADLRN